MNWRLLDGVPDEEVRLLLSVARRRRFTRGEVVFHRDDPADSLHLISSGRFAIRVTTQLGDTVTIAIRGPGDSFGEMALVTADARRSATIESLEQGETFCVHQADFERLRARHHSIDRLLIAFLAGEVRLLNERLLEALYLPVERRLLRRLAELAQLYGSDDDAPVHVPLTQEALAQLAGTSRATANQVLRDEEKRGTLELRRGTTIIHDRSALAQRAH